MVQVNMISFQVHDGYIHVHFGRITNVGLAEGDFEWLRSDPKNYTDGFLRLPYLYCGHPRSFKVAPSSEEKGILIVVDTLDSVTEVRIQSDEKMELICEPAELAHLYSRDGDG